MGTRTAIAADAPAPADGPGAAAPRRPLGHGGPGGARIEGRPLTPGEVSARLAMRVGGEVVYRVAPDLRHGDALPFLRAAAHPLVRLDRIWIDGSGAPDGGVVPVRVASVRRHRWIIEFAIPRCGPGPRDEEQWEWLVRVNRPAGVRVDADPRRPFREAAAALAAAARGGAPEIALARTTAEEWEWETLREECEELPPAAAADRMARALASAGWLTGFEIEQWARAAGAPALPLLLALRERECRRSPEIVDSELPGTLDALLRLAGTGDPRLPEAIVPLLSSDREEWIARAKEALVALGPVAVPAVARDFLSDDPFT